MESSKRTLTGVVMLRLNVVLLVTTVYYMDSGNANAIAAVLPSSMDTRPDHRLGGRGLADGVSSHEAHLLDIVSFV